MKQAYFLIITIFTLSICQAQSPVGKWKLISQTIVFEGKPIDMHAALLSKKPCAAKIVYEINADNTYRLNAAGSGCEERYIKMQQGLYAKSNWKVIGNKITVGSSKDLTVGATYIFKISGNKMTWVGTEGQGTSVYLKL